jgi:hypothetical protein
MATLTYSAICSLDLYVNDVDGSFDWAAPDEQVHAFVNEQERPVGTYLLGRGTYDTLKVWDTFGSDPGSADVLREYASIWRAADKVVYSASLGAVETRQTRIEREFDPAAVRAMPRVARIRQVEASQTWTPGADLMILRLASVVAVVTRALPDDARLGLELRATDRFDSGVVHLRYAVRR